jgi:hypothetical protein
VIQGFSLCIWWVVYTVGTAISVAPLVIVNYYHAALAWTNAIYAEAHRDLAYATGVLSGAINTAYHDALAALGYATAVLSGAINTAEAAAKQWATDLFSQASADINSVEAALGNEIQYVAGQIQSLDQVLTGGLATLAATVSAEIAAETSQAEKDIAAAVASAEAVAAGLASVASAGAIGALDKTVADVLNPALHALEDDLSKVAAALGAAAASIPGLEALLKNPTVIGTATGLAALGAIVGAIAAELSECVTPFCSSISKLDALLKALEDVAVWAALLALLIEAAHDPLAAVTAIEDGLADLAHATAAGFRDLIGI